MTATKIHSNPLNIINDVADLEAVFSSFPPLALLKFANDHKIIIPRNRFGGAIHNKLAYRTAEFIRNGRRKGCTIIDAAIQCYCKLELSELIDLYTFLKIDTKKEGIPVNRNELSKRIALRTIIDSRRDRIGK